MAFPRNLANWHQNPFEQTPPYAVTTRDQVFDRDLIGYKIGDQVEVAALAGFAGNPRQALRIGSLPNHIFRWKIQLAAAIPPGTVLPANGSAGLRFFVRASSGNEIITRRVFVQASLSNGVVGNASILYVFGRSIDFEVENPSGFPMTAHYGLDEATAGFSYWSDFQTVSTAAAEVLLDLPPFCSSFEVVTLSTSPGAQLRGYNAAGTLVYDEVLTSPRSDRIAVVPGLRYTLAASGGILPTNYEVAYYCLG
jgi:hypothetical protein